MTGPPAKSSISAYPTISSTDGGASSMTISEANMVGSLVESSISGISKRQLGQRARRERERSERTTIQHRFFPYLTEGHCHQSQSTISSIHEGATSTTFSEVNMAGPPTESSISVHPTISSTRGGATSMTFSKENMAGSPKISISANPTSSSSYRGATLATLPEASITTMQASISEMLSRGDVQTCCTAADALIKKAEMYQEYMKHILIPIHRDSVIPFTSWQGLARSVKQLYRQPLHYLTNILMKQWDLSRVGSEDEHLPLDTLIHPSKAEALIWVTEEVHRRTSSHHHLARLWSSDPMYHAYIDTIFP